MKLLNLSDGRSLKFILMKMDVIHLIEWEGRSRYVMLKKSFVALYIGILFYIIYRDWK